MKQHHIGQSASNHEATGWFNLQSSEECGRSAVDRLVHAPGQQRELAELAPAHKGVP